MRRVFVTFFVLALAFLAVFELPDHVHDPSSLLGALVALPVAAAVLALAAVLFFCQETD